MTVGTTVKLSVMVPSGIPITYQWFFNETNIIGFGTNAVLTLTNITLGQAGGYSVLASNIHGTALSDTATVSVYPTFAATLEAFSFWQGDGTRFEVNGVPGFNYTVQKSTNLVNWTPVMTDTAPFVFWEYDPTERPQQFYRAVYTP